MKKIKLLGLGNEKGKSFFVFEKTIDFFPLFSSFLEELGLEKTISFYEYDEKELLLDELIDKVENTKNELYDIDIFYGNESITVIIRSGIEREEYLPLIKKFVEYKSF